MRKRIKYIIEIILVSFIFLLFFNEMFHVDSTDKDKVFSPYGIMFNNLGDNLFVKILLWFSFIAVIAFVISLIIQLILVPKNRTIYYISIVLLTLSFVSFVTCGFINKDMSGIFYLVGVDYGLSLIGILSFELIASKGL